MGLRVAGVGAEGAQLGSSKGRESSLPSSGEGFREFSILVVKDPAWNFSAASIFLSALSPSLGLLQACALQDMVTVETSWS